eukprot:scaffold3851_cov162-Amphora_coffeaeformis.AAC.3
MDPSTFFGVRRMCCLVSVWVILATTDQSWGFSQKTVPIQAKKDVVGTGTALFSSPFSFGLDQLFRQTQSRKPDIASYQNGESAYPWRFTGRCIFVPSLVKVNKQDADLTNKNDLFVLNLLGWTVGGTVALEYDDSPVGYYREWVKLGGLAIYPRRSAAQQSLLTGQVGSKLYVSRPEAEVLCERVWGLVANKGASIQFLDNEDRNHIRLSQSARSSGDLVSLKASGWNHVRKSGGVSFKNLSLLVWTPTIKAIWAGLLSFRVSPLSDDAQDKENGDDLLPLHRLRLSGCVRPARIDWDTTDTTMLPEPQAFYFGLGLAVENLVIEISPPIPDP